MDAACKALIRKEIQGAYLVGFTKVLNLVAKPNQFNHLQHCTCFAQNFTNTISFRDALHFYSSLVRQCIQRTSLAHIKAVQTHMITSGFPISSLGNRLIHAYITCGSIVDARKLFDEMPDRHIVIWNSMIASYISNKKSEEAVRLFDRMIFEGVFPDEYTFSSVFKAFSQLGLEHEGQRAHGLSVVLGLDSSNAYVCSALIDMYAKFGKMRDARLVFNRVAVVERDVVLFTALIVGYSQRGEDSEALDVFRCMNNEGVRANGHTFASVLISCGNLEDLVNGSSVHGLIVKMGFESGVASQTSLLTMYSKCGLIDYSLKVFKGLDRPNLVTWTSIIAGLVQNDREEKALSKFRSMIRNSLIPNSFTLSSVLQACSSLAMLEEGKQIHAIVTKFGLDRDRYAGAALIDLYGKCGSTEMARLVFDSLTEVDVVSINSMMYSYAQNGFGYEALELFHRMEDMSLKPNDVTFISVLLACSNAGLVDEGCQIFSSIKNNHYIELSRDHYTCMVDLLGRSGRLEDAEMLIREVRNPDAVLWRTLLSACRIHGELEMAERTMKRVLELAPGDEGTCILLSNLYASTGKWNRFIDLKSTMREMKVKKNPAMSWVAVDKEVHTFMAGDLSHPISKEIIQKLEELFEKVKILGYVPDTKFVLQDLDEQGKESSLYYHSEKLAIAFALWKTSNKTSSIRILKNLRVCGDCHTWIKYVSKVVQREIIARDAKRFHHFRDGLCSCGDYW